MPDANELLAQIGKLFEAERAHTQKMVREEVEAQAKITRNENALTWTTLSAKIDRVENRLKDVEISNGRLEQGQAQTNSALEAVAAGQKDQATKDEIHRLEQ